MTMCRLPGCVAEAVGGDTCYVHATQQGKPCVACKGTARRPEHDKKTGAFVQWHPCDRCGATGLKDAHKGAPKVARTRVDERGLIQLAGEPDAPTEDAYDVAVREALK
jgi:DnaJ-class molecular chaperone